MRIAPLSRGPLAAAAALLFTSLSLFSLPASAVTLRHLRPGGNVQEWNDAPEGGFPTTLPLTQVVCGGGYRDQANFLGANDRDAIYSSPRSSASSCRERRLVGIGRDPALAAEVVARLLRQELPHRDPLRRGPHGVEAVEPVADPARAALEHDDAQLGVTREHAERDVMEVVGPDRFFWASDFPHPDHPPDYVSNLARLVAPMAPSTRERLLGRNVLEIEETTA